MLCSRYMSISDEWETPEKQPFKDFGNMRHWMEDPDCRDQYSVIYESGERTAIFNNDAKDPIVSEERAVSQPFNQSRQSSGTMVQPIRIIFCT
uniref:Uncharacterized protein n=1 Tax=Hucho hucho TaxID=62062 RepID=A0A4W5KPW8_9TELE